MPLAIGQWLLLHHLFRGAGSLVLLVIAALIVLLRFWPQVAAWIEQRWFKR